jgi:LytS/YehU family sensor histidine kinase
MTLQIGILVLLSLVLLSLVLIALRQHRRLRAIVRQRASREEEERTVEDRLQSLELETMKYKLNPHLFKNTLNTIQSHAYQTYYALDKLSGVLDYILYESNRPFVSLREEITFVLQLIEINRLKVSPLFNLQVKQKINLEQPLCTRELVAPLITVDLIENAFKHADLQQEGAFISILFELKDNVFSLTVSNKVSPQPPLAKERSGLGRAALQRRLSILYKDRYNLEQFMQQDVHTARLDLTLSE